MSKDVRLGDLATQCRVIQKKSKSTTMGALIKNLHNVEKEIELYADKIHRIDQRIEVIIFYNILLLKTNGKHAS